MAKIIVKDTEIIFYKKEQEDYISLTDIAFKFAAWISAEFELYLVTEFKQLKIEEQQALGWSANEDFMGRGK